MQDPVHGVPRILLLGNRVNSGPYPSSSAVVFGGAPYLLRIASLGEAAHNRPVGATQGYEAQIAHQIQALARLQP